MADPVESGVVFSIRAVMNNPDFVSNLLTAVAVACSSSVLVSFQQRLTGLAVIMALCTSGLFGAVGTLIMIQYGYGNLALCLIAGMVCGAGGSVMLLILIGVLQRFNNKRVVDAIAKKFGGQVGIDPTGEETK